ncbi:Guanosine-diphosphatase [Extremus antarcticus]|uniref:guanosine-diphosphatase n=1 Tax=Extremus antarcticus TaxID=702011 RepID=A0AAJ0LXJ5_9PEZI|nr:Guanosine-diphosphatase [Extremus antarcticus]
MSSQKDSSAWSYISTYKPRRRSSVKLPSTHDRFEKPDRHTSSGRPMQEKLQAAWMNPSPRTRYLKAGCLIAFVLLVLYHITPSSRDVSQVTGTGKFPGGDVASDASVATTRCTRSYSSDKPLIQFNNCGQTPELEDEVFEQTAKKKGGSGLSSYAGDAEGAARSLDVLLDVAIKNVPEKLRSCTPVAVKATAGLRKLGKEMSEEILKAVRLRVETVYPFPLVSDELGGVEVMDGKLEGVYAWITTNYLLGKIGGPDKTPTAAVFDLGGGSTQIVFEPTYQHSADGGMPDQMEEGDHKYELSFGGRKFALYQHSYLGYGLMEARDTLHRSVVQTLHESNPSSTAWLQQPISNPCLAAGSTGEIKVPMGENHALGSVVTVNMTGPTSGFAAQCRAIAEKALKKDAECSLAPCAFNGVHQPSLEKTFAREDLYLLSFFYDRTSELGMPETFTLKDLQDLTARVCQGADAYKSFETVPGAVKELQDRPETCLDLNFMMALLNTGYEMPMDRQVKIAKKIRGNELGWCLGASLPLLSGDGWSCRIKETS